VEYLKLNNNVLLPQEGFGVFQIEPDDCEKAKTFDAMGYGYHPLNLMTKGRIDAAC
jgi:hypothetical protein